MLELRNGISVRSTSFVGRIQLGDLQITIRPKIRHNMLVTLLRYAYHLRDIRLMADTKLEAEPDAFQDILIECLLAETSELISRGLHRQYRRLDAELPAPKGRIDVQRLALRNSTVQADIPVIYHLKLEDCLINQSPARRPPFCSEADHGSCAAHTVAPCGRHCAGGGHAPSSS